jgi:hypothetical protein
MKGRGMPITGANPIVIQMLMTIWKKNTEATP